MRFSLFLTFLMLGWSAHAQQFAGNTAVSAAALTRQEGFIPLYVDESGGRVLIEIPAFDEDVLYYVSAASGAGSVEIPLDRGILRSMVIRFVRSGSGVLVVQQNIDFRAVSGSAARAQNVANSFAESVLVRLPIISEAGEQVLVDASALFLRDAADIEGRLAGRDLGAFRYSREKSAFIPARTRSFPDNTEIETIASFQISDAGPAVAAVVPDRRVLSLHIRHSFLRAPVGYRPRQADSRIGVSAIEFRDHAQALDDDIEQRWITRWRLEKQDPDAALSEPVTPIVFYLDPAIEEPVRSAMRAGALWWNEAFEAAGFLNAVQVRDPEPDMDPMDIRYAWILWIDRDQRGFSSGGTYRDPRTGEILGSKTRMDSHRIRTIANYWEAYSAAMDDSSTSQQDMVLLRQSLLTAHELGHVLGFGHNFASSMNDRASVMEYPTPRVRVIDGELDLSESFAAGVGDYDRFMARYAYTPFAADAEAEGLNDIVAQMRAAGLLYVPSTDPRWTWYDDLSDPVEYLRTTIEARTIMMARYGEEILEPGEALGSLRDVRLWMAYLHHRWAIEAAQRFVGGMYHNYVVKGESDLPATAFVPGEMQRDLLGLLVAALEPQSLSIPEDLLVQLTVHPGTNIEDLSDDYLFDHLRAARILAEMIVDPLLQPDRAARMIALADRDPTTLTLPEMLHTLLEHTWHARPADLERHAALYRVTQSVVLESMMRLAAAADVSPQVRAFVLEQLSQLGDELTDARADDPLTLAHYRQAGRDIERFIADPQSFDSALTSWGERPRSRFPLPPGPPL